jgi:hypothetical protein
VNGEHAPMALDRETQLREWVLGYLAHNPTAMDTLDGIAEWWIRRQQIEVEVRHVSNVLAKLVREGVLEEFQQGGVVFYRRRGPAVANIGVANIGVANIVGARAAARSPEPRP